MTEYEISSGALSARVSSAGAELKSLRLRGREYLWPGGAEWKWSAPVCCPYCGAVEGDGFTHGGAEYAAPRHGFVRESEHRLIERGEGFCALGLTVGEGDERWPWPFELAARFELGGDTLTLGYSVANAGAEPMPLQLGFHPGFLAPKGSVLRAERPELPGNTDALRLRPGLFDAGSVDLARPESAWFRLERGDGGAVTVDARGFGWFLLWGAPGETPFVCLEPWQGYVGPGALPERPGAVMLRPGESLSAALKVRLE